MDCAIGFGGTSTCRSDGGAAMVGRPFPVQLFTPPSAQLVTRNPEERELGRDWKNSAELSIVMLEALAL
jgi:hypothetical protein